MLRAAMQMPLNRTVYSAERGNTQNSQAAQWIIQDITEHVDDFVGKKWKFELPVTNANSNPARIDMAYTEKPPKFIEYKWLTTKTVSKEEFIDQFVKRDLFNNNLTDLAQLEWRIKGQKLTKDKVVEYLSSVEGKSAIHKKAIELFENFGKGKNPTLSLEDINDLIDYLKTNDDWFTLIFK
jgi:hypothetical protein